MMIVMATFVGDIFPWWRRSGWCQARKKEGENEEKKVFCLSVIFSELEKWQSDDEKHKTFGTWKRNDGERKMYDLSHLILTVSLGKCTFYVECRSPARWRRRGCQSGFAQYRTGPWDHSTGVDAWLWGHWMMVDAFLFWLWWLFLWGANVQVYGGEHRERIKCEHNEILSEKNDQVE